MMHSSACALAQASGARDPIAGQSTIVDLFGLQVLARPFATALEVNEKALTYWFLNIQIDRLANQLRAIGIGRGDVVSICLRRTENLVIALLGVLKAGAAYVPLNPSDPPLRLGQVIAHASSRCVLSDSRSLTNLPSDLPLLIELDQQFNDRQPNDRQRDDQQPDDTRPAESDSTSCAPHGNDLAYVIYTSGTTGKPKGVAVEHASLANIVVDVAQRLAFSEQGSWLAVTNVSFDIAALELLLPLCYGGKVILASEEQTRIGRVLSGILQLKKPTVMQATPITWRILLESGWTGAENLTILCGGDRLDRDLAGKLMTRASAVWNMYGPTETTIWSTADKLSLDDDKVTIGRPLANNQIYILDSEGQPTGDLGEICIGGAGVARGYVNDSSLTRQCFIELKVDGSSTTRVYRTGDLGRWNEQGKLEFYGRIDHQVKINGFRIELGEIESVIRKCTGVADVAVLGVNGASNQKQLYAFVVPHGDGMVSAAEIVAHLTQYLPRYMVPHKFWYLDRLPSTSNGKRDVVALEALTRAQSELPVLSHTTERVG